VRAYLERWPDETLAVLMRWTRDPNAHVRRLVSEGTRPRLPWAPRVSWIEAQPERVLPLLEALKDDRASTVRRSVANHLNDLSKRHSALAFEIAERWLDGASEERRALVEHALRSAAKRGEPQALALLGFGARAEVEVVNSTFTPARVAIGGKTRVRVEVRDARKSKSKGAQNLTAELVVHFVKANGKTSAKVFQLAQLSLAPGEHAVLEKTISLAVHTTRKPYPGRHAVDVRFNGTSVALGAFTVVSANSAKPRAKKSR
jgi:3-methyladenine DNA glycosylase AlkC